MKTCMHQYTCALASTTNQCSAAWASDFADSYYKPGMINVTRHANAIIPCELLLRLYQDGSPAHCIRRANSRPGTRQRPSLGDHRTLRQDPPKQACTVSHEPRAQFIPNFFTGMPLIIWLSDVTICARLWGSTRRRLFPIGRFNTRQQFLS